VSDVLYVITFICHGDSFTEENNIQ